MLLNPDYRMPPTHHAEQTPVTLAPLAIQPFLGCRSLAPKLCFNTENSKSGTQSNITAIFCLLVSELAISQKSSRLEEMQKLINKNIQQKNLYNH